MPHSIAGHYISHIEETPKKLSFLWRGVEKDHLIVEFNPLALWALLLYSLQEHPVMLRDTAKGRGRYTTLFLLSKAFTLLPCVLSKI
jgi:hypothetical protein